jgi:hypothetical protein
VTIRTAITAAVLIGALGTHEAAAQFACGAGCHLVSGSVSDATTGAFIAGDVYIVTANMTVPAGATLTVGAGTIVKFNGNVTLSVFGTLLVNGAPGSEAIFTSIHDDVGGDHNNNGGATVPVAGQWGRIVFASSSDASVLNGAIVRYAGAAGNPALDLTLSDLTATNCVVTSVAGPCIGLTGNSHPLLTSCAFNNGTLAVAGAPIAALAGFAGCTATGNTVLDAVQVTATTVNGAISVLASNATNGDGVFAVAGTVVVGAADSLVLGAGVRFKFTGNFVVNVDGVLTANGTSAAPVVFTSIHDDTVGGDTNKNGAASAAGAGQWFRLDFAPTSDASSLTHVVVRCAGSAGNAALDLDAANVALTSVSTALLGGPCLHLSANSFPTVVGCAFNGGTKAVSAAPIAALAAFSGNTAAGNSVYDAPEATATTVTGALSLVPDDTMNGDGVVVLAASLDVPAAASLTLGAGMKCKFAGNHLVDVDGTLTTNGAAGAPVVFTSIHDDAHGGDTNKNASATGPAAGQWSRLDFAPASDASSLTHTIVRCAGSSSNAALDLNAADIALTSVSTALLGGPCMRLTLTSFPTATNCAFDGGTVAVSQTPLHALPGFVGCTASGNSVLNAHYVETATTNGDLAISAANTMNGAGVVVVATTLGVAAGTTLTLGAGVIVKFDGNRLFTVSGTFVAAGVAGSPVVCTSVHDDAYGGDTNQNGAATTLTAGQWNRIDFAATTDASTADFLVVRGAGALGNAALDLNSSDATFRDCVVQSVGGACLDLGLNSRPFVERCAFNGGQRPVANARVDGLERFRFCTAAGNSLENAPRISSASLGLGETAKLDRINSMNGDGVFVVSASIAVSPGATLDVGRGVRFKFTGNQIADFAGQALLRGSGRDPVTFTSIHDDAVGGDTNLNGAATTPAPGQFIRVRFVSSATGVAEHVYVRYAGSSGNNAFECDAAGVTVRSIRVERCAADGIVITDAAGGFCDNLVAWNNLGDGIRYDASVSLRHPTSAYNGQFGVVGLVPTPGAIVNGVFFGNTSGPANSVPAAQASYTCGFSGGGPGNFVADPLFVDGVNGDLRLQPASPCVDTADSVTGYFVTKDHVEASRLGDGKLLGAPFADMGAYELAPFELVVVGEPWSNTVVTFEVVGPPGAAALAIGNLSGTELYLPYGISLADPLAFLVPFVILPTNTVFPLPLPDLSTFAGQAFGVQALATSALDPSKGGFTNLYRAVLDG